MKSMAEAFVRVLDPADPWLRATEENEEERIKNFKGRYPDISIAMSSRCVPKRVVAVLHGLQKRAVLPSPSYFDFTDEDVALAGGLLADTNAEPQWPSDYNEAHHDIVENQQAVATRMAELGRTESNRVVPLDDVGVLMLIAELAEERTAPKRFKKNVAYRFRRMFEDGGEERQRWLLVAMKTTALFGDGETQKQFRKLYQDTAGGREEWSQLVDQLGLSPEERKTLR